MLDVPSSQRLDKAVRFYERSAQKGNSEAMTDLGFLSEKGFLGPPGEGLSRAVKHYKSAIAAGNPRAMNNLAGLFLSGRLTRQPRGELRGAERARGLQVVREGERHGQRAGDHEPGDLLLEGDSRRQGLDRGQKGSAKRSSSKKPWRSASRTRSSTWPTSS